MKIFTREKLEKYDGSNGIAYIACYGKVYDVSNSYHWRRGVHQVLHHAGGDLSDALEQAPHGFHLLKKFPIVGELQDADRIKQ
jgi:predicted heme/steroid binding protein